MVMGFMGSDGNAPNGILAWTETSVTPIKKQSGQLRSRLPRFVEPYRGFPPFADRTWPAK